MRLAFFLDRFPEALGGTERQFLLLTRELIRRHIECTVYTLRGPSNLRELLPGANCCDLMVPRIASVHALTRIGTALRDEKRRGTRVVQTFLNDVSFVVPPLARAAGLRTVVARRDVGFWYTRLGLHALRLVSRCVDAYAVNSTAVADAVTTNERARAPIRIIRNAIAPQSTALDRTSARLALGLGLHEFVIVCVANLKPLKRQETAIAALALLPDNPSVRLVLVGDDTAGIQTPSYRSELLRLAADLGVSPLLLMTGHLSDPTPAWAAADVGLLLSDSEGLSNAVLEGLAAKVPMICTAVGGNLELIQDGVNGFLVECRDERAVAAAINRLRVDPELRRCMSENALESVRNRNDVVKMTDEYVALYNQLAA